VVPSNSKKPHSVLFLAQRASQFRQRDVLQLTDPFARDTQEPAYFLERFLLSAFESKALGDDFLLALVEPVEVGDLLSPRRPPAPSPPPEVAKK
jgi:hypothetical protein